MERERIEKERWFVAISLCDDKMRLVVRSLARLQPFLRLSNLGSIGKVLSLSLSLSLLSLSLVRSFFLSFFVISPSSSDDPARFGMRRSYADEAERGQQQQQYI